MCNSLGANVIHEHLVGGQFVLQGRPRVVGLFQPDSTAKLIQNLDPEARLRKKRKHCLSCE